MIAWIALGLALVQLGFIVGLIVFGIRAARKYASVLSMFGPPKS